jgi:membrane protein DedA with SNARE-associated domain
MDFALGMLTGMFIMFAIAKRLQVELMNDVDKLKDFDTWKEWKNKKK